METKKYNKKKKEAKKKNYTGFCMSVANILSSIVTEHAKLIVLF